MSVKLGVPGDGVGSGHGVAPRGSDDSGLLGTLRFRSRATTRLQLSETRRTRLRPEFMSLLRRESESGWLPAAELVLARLWRRSSKLELSSLSSWS